MRAFTSSAACLLSVLSGLADCLVCGVAFAFGAILRSSYYTKGSHLGFSAFCGLLFYSSITHKVTCGQVSGFLLPRVTTVQHLRRRVLRGTTAARCQPRYPPRLVRSSDPARPVRAVAKPLSRGSTSQDQSGPVRPHTQHQSTCDR